jgi:hypothetical protein
MGALTKTYNMAALNIYLPVQFNQLVDLIKSLPKEEKKYLIDLLEQDAPETIPDWQKKEVDKRIKKYDQNPGLLIEEKKALKMINLM